MGVQSLANTIARIMKNNKGTTEPAIKRGMISGNRIIVDGADYNYSVAVDVDVSDGDYVYIIFNDSHNRAVVIGK